eukprot:scaffold9210_cov137-Skeletonema_marinoi.AAC.3
MTQSWKQTEGSSRTLGHMVGCYGETSREDRLGKYIDGGKKVHCDCGRCKRPHMLDEGGKQVHLWKILATGGKSPHMLDEGDKQDI